MTLEPLGGGTEQFRGTVGTAYNLRLQRIADLMSIFMPSLSNHCMIRKSVNIVPSNLPRTCMVRANSSSVEPHAMDWNLSIRSLCAIASSQANH